MGRKVHPNGFRLKFNKTWDGRWYAEGKDYVNRLHQDFEIRRMVHAKAPRAGISKIEIERFPGNVKIQVHTAKPGILIGKKGENVKEIRKALEVHWKKQKNFSMSTILFLILDALLEQSPLNSLTM